MTRIFRSAWFMVIKVALMLLSFFFIYYHVSSREVGESYVMMRNKFFSDEQTRMYIYVALALVPVNWLIETIKWKMLSASFTDQSLRRSLRAVLAGVAVSFFTPNRSGDFAGRILLLPAEHRLNGTLYSIAGSLAQLLVTITAGSICFLITMDHFLDISSSFDAFLYIIIPFAVVALHFFFIRLPFLADNIARIKFKNKWLSKLSRIKHIDQKLLVKVYILSVVRYAVFTLQFYILLLVFDADFMNERTLVLIMVSFLMITLIPSFALSEIGIRGSVCIFLFSSFGYDVSGVLIASTFLWIINIALPASAGAVSILYFKLGS